MNDVYKKSGYLTDDFKIFYLCDKDRKEFDYHYHDFHKLLILLGGHIRYAVEGREYDLCPGDIILIPAGEVHRPVIHNDMYYKRMIIYISDHFFDVIRQEGCDLSQCFLLSRKYNSNLIRFPAARQTGFLTITNDIIDSFHTSTSSAPLYQKIKFIELLLLLNEKITEDPSVFLATESIHPVILEILNYVNEHVTDDLSIDIISDHVFLNRSYVMHLFKAETGYTIGKYITEKRLFLANNLILQGMCATEACYQSGFRNYTTFYQAYKSKYKRSPKEILKKK